MTFRKIGVIVMLVIVTIISLGVIMKYNNDMIAVINSSTGNFNLSKKTANKSDSILIAFNNVTNIIHLSWKTKNIPEYFNKYLKSWKELCFKNWTFMFWTDEDNYNLVKTHYPWFLKKYKELPKNIYRADVSRYFYLFHYGGIYTDLDNECLRPFDHLLNNYSLVFGAMKGQYLGTNLPEGYVQNSFMYSRPRQTFWLEILQDILSITNNQAVEVHTGPVMLSKRIKLFRDRFNVSKELIIYPPYYFNPFSWIDTSDVDKNCKSHNGMTSENWEKCRKSMIAKGSYVIQYHAHTWG